MTDDGFESQLLRFEEAWRRDGPRELADFLANSPVLSSAARFRLLVELICVDLEFRWRNRDSDRRAMLESYVARFPQLGPLDGLPVELIVEEYRVRHRWGDRPPHAEFLSRFTARRDEIRAELSRIDRDLEDEADPRSVARPAVRAPLPAGQADPHLGGPLLSHRDFLLRRLIGAGRFGKVYQARQYSTGREVAVKFLRKTLLQEPVVVRRFIDEARTIAGLCHPRIVGTQGLGRTSGGSYFIVMDLAAGPDLAQLGKTRPIAVNEVVRWAIGACEALEFAHGMGIIHCDLKPANLLLDAAGGIRVTDFGLARSLSGPARWTVEVEGTAPFMAPEQVSRGWGRIDQRTDVYGIGAVLFALLAGRPPHVGRRLPEILAEVVGAAPVVALKTLRPDIPEPLDELCRKCLCKVPEGRYPTIQEVRAVLVDLLDDGVDETYRVYEKPP
jgi:tRNA A-37 threonylcarbamoyl transferase component Bud32